MDNPADTIVRNLLNIMRFYHCAAIPENEEDTAVCDMPENCGHCKAVREAVSYLENAR